MRGRDWPRPRSPAWASCSATSARARSTRSTSPRNPPAPRSGDAGSGPRHRLADLLVAHRRHLDQIRDPHHARRQPRRGRHPGAARAGQPAPRQAEQLARARWSIVGLVGATLLYGDGTITPAISVLSAIEGLKIYAPHLEHAVVPMTVLILVGLFLIQRNGTSFIGGLFGPVMLVWFVVAGRARARRHRPNAGHARGAESVPAITYLWHAGALAFVVIGGAFLAVTGGEAFYADMGHFGPLPIRVAWFGVALPALTLNYFGQGGLLLAEPHSPEVVENPFFALAPHWAHYPLILLATVATVIASQSIISGAYSMTQQAINLGFLPRMKVVHTEGREIGQIYVPFVNWALAAGTLAAVVGFGSSDALAGAFGIAVSLLMVITTLMATFVALHWKYNPLARLRRQRQPARAGTAVLRLDLDETPRGRLVSPAHRLRDLVPHADLAQGRGGHGRRAARGARARRRFPRAAHSGSAPSHPGNRHRARPDGQGRAARALAQRQLQPRLARERAAGRGDDDRNAATCRTKTGHGHTARRGHRARRIALWLHGGAERPGGARRRDGARPDREIRSRRRSTLPATRRSLPRAGARACRDGARRSSPSCTTTRSGRAPISRFPARRSWRSASNSRSDTKTR